MCTGCSGRVLVLRRVSPIVCFEGGCATDLYARLEVQLVGVLSSEPAIRAGKCVLSVYGDFAMPRWEMKGVPLRVEVRLCRK